MHSRQEKDAPSALPGDLGDKPKSPNCPGHKPFFQLTGAVSQIAKPGGLGRRMRLGEIAKI